MLTKDLYRNTDLCNCGPFGLSNDQLRMSEGYIVQNAGWYNKLGEFVGYGDLTGRDLQRIANELPPDDTFVILSEDDWRRDRPDFKYKEVGREYLKERARCVIKGGRIYLIQRHDDEATSLNRWEGASITLILRRELWVLLS